MFRIGAFVRIQNLPLGDGPLYQIASRERNGRQYVKWRIGNHKKTQRLDFPTSTMTLDRRDTPTYLGE